MGPKSGVLNHYTVILNDFQTIHNLKIEDPVPYVLEVNNPHAHRPALLQSHPQSYLASFYQLKGHLEKARTTFKAIIEALTNRFEESQPFILQLGYNFEVNIINKNKARVCIKVATTRKNCADPFWETFGLSNADFFDYHQEKEPKIVRNRGKKFEIRVLSVLFEKR